MANQTPPINKENGHVRFDLSSLEKEKTEKSEITHVALSKLSTSSPPTSPRRSSSFEKGSFKEFKHSKSEAKMNSPRNHNYATRINRAKSFSAKLHLASLNNDEDDGTQEVSNDNNVESKPTPPLPPPVWNKKTWKKSACVLTALDRFAKKCFLESVTEPQVIVNKFIEEELLSLLGIFEKIQPVAHFENTKFLSNFLNYKSITQFCAEAKSLQPKDKMILENFMGKDVLSCLELCLKPSALHWDKYVESLKREEEAISSLSSRKLNFPPNFDHSYPTSNINRENILDSFRSLCTADFKENIPIFTFNGNWIACPSWEESQSSYNDRIKSFLTWLVKNLNKACGVTDENLAIQQVESFYQMPFDMKDNDINELSQALKTSLQKAVTPNGLLIELLMALEDSTDKIAADCSKAFILWISDLNKLEKLLHDNSSTKVRDCVQNFVHIHWLKHCHQHVPCFRILQALSFSAYGHAESTLRETFCPNLMLSGFDVKSIRMKYFSTDDTQWKIETNAEAQTFNVLHIKPYRFIQGNTQENVEIGRIKVYWRLSGHFKKDLFTANIWCEDLHFLDIHPLTTRFPILKNLGLSLEEKP